MTTVNTEIDSAHINAAYHRMDFKEIANRLVTTGAAFSAKVQTCAMHTFEKIQNCVAPLDLPYVIAKINGSCTEVERVFNFISCIPFIGIVGSALEMIAGKIQMIAGLIVVGVAHIGVLIERRHEGETELMKKWQVISTLGFEHILHGCLNIIRGLGQVLLARYTFFIGNAILLLPNLIDNRNFEPYFAYGSLVNQKI